ncbi:MAG: DUF2975 domain-containing protein [Myxococcota bacterium]
MTDLRRITRLARISWFACAGLALATPVATALGVFLAPAETLFAPLGFSSLGHASTAQILVSQCLSLSASCLAGGALWALARGFRRVAQGEVFADEVVRALTRFAGLLALSSLAAILTAPIVSLLLSIGTPPGEGRLSLQFGSANAFGLVASLAVWTLSRIMVEARRLERENREFV